MNDLFHKEELAAAEPNLNHNASERAVADNAGDSDPIGVEVEGELAELNQDSIDQTYVL